MKLFSFSSFLVLKNLNNNLFVFISNFFPVKFGRQSAKFYWVISSWKYGIKLDTNVLLVSISCQHSSIGDKLIEETRTRKFPRNHQQTAGWLDGDGTQQMQSMRCDGSPSSPRHIETNTTEPCSVWSNVMNISQPY